MAFPATEALGNIARLLQRSLQEPGRKLYRHSVAGKWEDLSAADIASLAARWQALYRTRGCAPGDRVGLWMKNGIQWVAADQAALGLGLVVVPLYIDDNPENAAWCLRDAGAELVVTETGTKAASLRQAGVPPEHMLVLRPDEGPAAAGALLPLSQNGYAVERDDAQELATICYTSGTSGRPKGVMLTHANILSNVAACEALHLARPSDVFLSILPLSHMFERTGGCYLPLAVGAQVVFSRGVAYLAEDLVSQAPTVLFGVPRIFDRFAARIDDALGRSRVKRFLFRQCVQSGIRSQQQRPGPLDWLFAPWLRRFVAAPILARLGGRLRISVVGGAALDPQIARRFIGLGVPLLQGYGLTEASPVVSVNLPDDNAPESVGFPLQGLEVKCTETHELLVRGKSVMQGYWNLPEATAAVLDEQGWLHSGDLGVIRAGRIYLHGRAKDILVLSTGEKVSPQDVELAILRDAVFEQAMLVGEARPFLLLLAVTDEANERALIRRANAQLKNFPGYIRIRRVLSTREPWTIESGLLTPTLKLKRTEVALRFAKPIESAYLRARKA